MGKRVARITQQAPNWSDHALLDRPGFLIRRLHQIHVALFLEECAVFDITPLQYSLLTILSRTGEREQADLARELGIDRTNTADVASRLERRDLLRRRVSQTDRRARIISITDQGRKLLDALDGPAERAHARTIEGLSVTERRQFISFLVRLVEAGNHMGRARLKLP